MGVGGQERNLGCSKLGETRALEHSINPCQWGYRTSCLASQELVAEDI